MKKKATRRKKLDIGDRLLRLAADYIEEKGGKAIVVGPICVIKLPNTRKYIFTLGIACVGTPPKKEKQP